MTTVLPRLPDARPLLLKALPTVRRKVSERAVLPPLEVRVNGVQADAATLAAYRQICGFAESDTLPITYPQVLAGALHLWLMTQPSFPYPLLGLVHLRNRIEQAAPLPADGRYDLIARIGNKERVPAGIAFELITELRDEAGELRYSAITTPLVRVPSDKKRAKSEAPPLPALSQYRLIDVPEDTGRRYAAVSGDYNPIHLHALSAKLFGFPRAIAHGMWSVARVAALLEPQLRNPARELRVQYRAPLLLPSRATLKFGSSSAGSEFQLLAVNGDKVHLTGQLA